MEIELTHVPVRDLVEGYADAGDVGGVVGYGGRLNIRPAYQREFVYKDSQRDAVIRSVMAGFPLNVMYLVGARRRHVRDHRWPAAHDFVGAVCES